jgi:hypothetical protein
MSAVLEIDSKRRTWDNSPELRESVRDDLYEWGMAQRGGMPNIGYPSRSPVFSDDTSPTYRYDEDKIDEMNGAFRMWLSIIERADDQNARRIFKRQFRVIKHYFIGSEPVEQIAEKLGCSTATTYRALGEGMYRFWRLMDDSDVYRTHFELSAGKGA